MSVMNRALFKKQLQQGLNTVFGLEYRQYPEEWRDIFDVSNSTKAYEEDVLMSGLGAAVVKAEGAGVTYDSGSELWTARYTAETIALAFAITEEAVEDGLYGNLGAKYSRSLARSMQHTKEVKGAAVLNNGFSSSYTGGDGKEMFATDHPVATGGTQSNELATPADLSETSMETMLIQIRKAKDDRGLPIALTPMQLIVPPDEEYNAVRLLSNPNRPETSDRDINAARIARKSFYSKGASVVTRLSDADAWFVKTDCPDGLKHFVRKKISRRVEGDFETGNMRYRARERYVFGWSDWRGAFASAGA